MPECCTKGAMWVGLLNPLMNREGETLGQRSMRPNSQDIGCKGMTRPLFRSRLQWAGSGSSACECGNQLALASCFDPYASLHCSVQTLL